MGFKMLLGDSLISSKSKKQPASFMYRTKNELKTNFLNLLISGANAIRSVNVQNDDCMKKESEFGKPGKSIGGGTLMLPTEVFRRRGLIVFLLFAFAANNGDLKTISVSEA